MIYHKDCIVRLEHSNFSWVRHHFTCLKCCVLQSFRNKLPSLRFGTRLRLREKRRHKFQTWHVHTTLTSRSCGAIRRLRRHESVFIAPATSMFVLTLHPGRQTAHYRGKLECLNHDNLVVQTFLFSQHECF